MVAIYPKGPSTFGTSQELPGASLVCFITSGSSVLVQGSARQLLDAIKQAKDHAWQLLAQSGGWYWH